MRRNSIAGLGLVALMILGAPNMGVAQVSGDPLALSDALVTTINSVDQFTRGPDNDRYETTYWLIGFDVPLDERCPAPQLLEVTAGDPIIAPLLNAKNAGNRIPQIDYLFFVFDDGSRSCRLRGISF